MESESEEVRRARFKADELYRLVYQREYDEPDWAALNTRYEGRIGYILREPYAIAVHPYSAGKWYIEELIEKIWIRRDDEPRLPDGSDPSLITYDDEVAGCD